MILPRSTETTIKAMPKNHNQNNFFSDCMRNKQQYDEAFIRETQVALKTLSNNWNESTTATSSSTSATKAKYVDNSFDDGKMSPISSSTINYTSYDTTNTKIKSHKKYRPNEPPKYPTHDFTDLVDDCSNECDKTSTYTPLKDNKCESNVYDQMAEYRMPVTFNTPSSSAFRPPFNDGKRGNAFNAAGAVAAAATTTATMPYSAYHFNDTGGYSNYSHDMATTTTPTTPNATATGTGERDKHQFDKPYGKDDEINVNDSKEYTTLQPAKMGSKAESVIQEVARDGFAMANAVSNSTATNLNATQPLSTMASAPSAAGVGASHERTFYETSTTGAMTATVAAAMAAVTATATFPPGNPNKGKYK